jgi:hypothetical protein
MVALLPGLYRFRLNQVRGEACKRIMGPDAVGRRLFPAVVIYLGHPDAAPDCL